MSGILDDNYILRLSDLFVDGCNIGGLPSRREFTGVERDSKDVSNGGLLMLDKLGARTS